MGPSTDTCSPSAALGPAPISRPALGLLVSEPWRAALELASHRLGRGFSTVQRKGDGHPVVIFPGLAADGSAVATLREHCTALGYTAFDWGRGLNVGPRGDVDAWMADLADHVRALLERHEGRATLVGWSLGGLYARELGKLLAPQVRRVITIGTPFNAEADHSHVGWLYRLLNGAPARLDAAMSRRLRTPPPVPTASIYSRNDGIVAWQTCIHGAQEHATGLVRDLEVDSSHIGMVWNPRVLNAVGELLALPGTGA
ncbi:alpha/beta fold hydrolase [Rhizobacter sp. SG703]|uniref:alpha/beta fold hydrolase n=1 Tax=Rhizobacter sp. SG703 TaxID=2587140 RepID=UPI0014457B7A|nr:alpha/beta fold hydrolase [Rhizobacter sp. SG703]NKI94625.1 pimeloyl-ACP methyl ester carboxylesterase [Rhizobacter sp. SG703]